MSSSNRSIEPPDGLRRARSPELALGAATAADLPPPAGGGLLASAWAAARGALLLEAAGKLGADGDAEAIAEAIGAAAKQAGLPAGGLVAPLRAAALSLETDDGAARIAAAMFAQRLAELLGG